MAEQKKRVRSKQVGADKAAQEIKRLWGDVEVIDGTKDLRVIMTEEDVRGAIRKDPSACVFARACKRAYGSTKVLIFRSVAYVDLPNEDGTIRVERFTMPNSMRALVEDFDRGLGCIPRGGFTLLKPTKSKTLNVSTKQKKASRQRAKLRQILAGEMIEPEGKTNRGVKYQDKPLVIDLDVRNGSGAVHFNKKKKRANKA